AMKMELHGVLRPVSAPVVVQVDLYGLELLIDAFGEQCLNARIFGKGNMRANVEQKPALKTERCGVTAMIGILVVHDRRDTFGMEAVSGTEPGHSGTEDDDIWAWHFRCVSLFPAPVRVTAFGLKRI